MLENSLGRVKPAAGFLRPTASGVERGQADGYRA